MVGSVEQIEQDLAAIEQLIAELAEEFHQAYSSYLTVLGQAARQQLILASYHVCTQGYPTRFLDLSFSQRQQLQQNIRQLANQLQEDLLAQLYPPTPIELLDNPESVDTLPSSSTLDPLTELLTPTEALPVEPAPEPQIDPEPKAPRSLTPTDLAHWREALEQSIVEELRTVSHAANRLLQQVEILPKQLPEPVLQAASKAEMPDVAPHSPNLLNVLIASTNEAAIEDDGLEELPSSAMMHIVAIHLRLSDIEFATTPVTAARTRLRNFSGRLKTIGREYYKKQQERAIAKAQAAWRATWFEE